MNRIGILFLFFVFWLSAVEAKAGCVIEKLGSIQTQKMAGWIISIEKEHQRKKAGDSLLAINVDSGKRCEIELESWGTGLYLARGEKFSIIVEQQDTSDTSLAWIDPGGCKILKTLREFGTVQIRNSLVSFSGGKDGPDRVPGKEFPLNAACFPISK